MRTSDSTMMRNVHNNDYNATRPEKAVLNGTKPSPEMLVDKSAPSIDELSANHVILYVAIFGNALVMLTILFQRSLKTNYYLLVFHLALCDTALASFNIVQCLLSARLDLANHDYLFAFTLALVDVAYFAELSIIMLIAVLRYKAIARPFSQHPSRRKLSHVIVAIYLLALAIGLASLLYDVFRFRFSSSVDKIFAVIVYTVPYLTAVFGLPVLYASMCYALHVHGEQMKKFEGEKDPNIHGIDLYYLKARQKRNSNTMRTSVLIVGLFLLSSFPNQLRVIDNTFQWFTTDFYYWSLTAYFLGVVTVNPLIYAFCDKTILAGYKKTLRKLVGFCGKKHTSAETEVAV